MSLAACSRPAKLLRDDEVGYAVRREPTYARSGPVRSCGVHRIVRNIWPSDRSKRGFRVDRPYIVRVRWERIDRMWVREFGWGEGRTGADVAVTARQGEFPSIGRFPQGLRGELLGRVLALLGQRELEELQ